MFAVVVHFCNLSLEIGRNCNFGLSVCPDLETVSRVAYLDTGTDYHNLDPDFAVHIFTAGYLENNYFLDADNRSSGTVDGVEVC